jgi:hypothetical protein
VEYAVFGRGDAMRERFLASADIRIVFGTDDAADAIGQAAPNPRAKAFYFTDRQSQAWIEPEAATDDVLADLIRAFNVYGQAGCTSPRRVVLLGADMSGALALRDRIVRLWPATIRTSPPAMRTCSDNTLALQWARALGWDAIAVPEGRAVVAVAPIGVPTLDSPMFLAVSPATVDEALAALPANVQTVGHALHSNSEWLNLVARTTIKRWVPISRMHHFGPVWDGDEFWHECFEYVEIDT